MVKCLVTGAGGFLGRYIAEQLVLRGDTVRGLARGHYPELESIGVEMRRATIHDAVAVLDACDGVDIVFHAAGIAGIWGKWRDYYETNTLGTRNVIAACRARQVSRLVYTSSPSVTFDGRDQCNVDERAPYPKKWLCHYAHTKALAEQEALAANEPGRLATCSLRPHLIWGPRDNQLGPRLWDRARQGRLRLVGDGNNLIDTIYVENAAAAHVAAAEALSRGSPVAGRAYFLTQGEPIPCGEWINRLLAVVGLPPERRAIPFRLAYSLGALLEGVYTLTRLESEPPMTRFLAAQLGKSHYFDTSRARRDFGFVPKVSTANGLERLARHISANGERPPRESTPQAT